MLELATDAGPADGLPAEVAQVGLVRRRVRDLIEAVLRCATAGPVLPARARACTDHCSLMIKTLTDATPQAAARLNE